MSALVGRDDGQRPPTHTQPHGFVSDDRDDGLSPPHSLVKTRHARERHPHPYKACFVLQPNRCGTSQSTPLRERYPHPYKACFVLLPNRCGTSQSTPLREQSVPAGTSIRNRLYYQMYSPATSTILSALVGRDDGQRPPTLTQPHGFVSDDRDDGLSPHTHSSKRVMLGRGIHTLIRHASFSSPTDVGPHNPPPKGSRASPLAHRFGTGSDTKCNNPAASTILSALVGRDDGQRPPRSPNLTVLFLTIGMMA
ncbi:hypothetical protein PIB30_099148 [Stylosanthes scabra]|uniref:Uncharacterized protein n=1 Tax=Stylosanthes scabra TaxID=79078 RepID=A0ABU6WYI9_9FABA|nr:hypothetical protein [Stylosanthes scabra]